MCEAQDRTGHGRASQGTERVMIWCTELSRAGDRAQDNIGRDSKGQSRPRQERTGQHRTQQDGMGRHEADRKKNRRGQGSTQFDRTGQNRIQSGLASLKNLTWLYKGPLSVYGNMYMFLIIHQFAHLNMI